MNAKINDQKFIDNIALSLKNSKIFLTGGTGFFGKSFIELLILLNKLYSLNVQIYVLARNPENFKKNYPHLTSDFIDFQEGNIIDFQYSNTKFDYIFHFATPASSVLNVENPLAIFDNIMIGSRRILDFAVHCGCKKFLFASSGAVYGRQPTEITHVPETYTGAPLTKYSHSAYGESKRAAEVLGNIYSEKYGFEHKIARCFAFVGPHLDPNGAYAVGNFIRDAITSDKIIIGGDGTPFRSYLYSVDLVYWLLAIAFNGENKIPYNVGSDQDISIFELAKTVANIINPNIEIIFSKKPVIGSGPDRYVPEIKLAKSTLGVKVWTPLTEGIQQTAMHYQKILRPQSF